jgi:hypothetical protein
MAEHSTQNPKIKGSNLAIGTWGDEMTVKMFMKEVVPL